MVEDFDIAPNKIGESAQRVVDRAMEEARRRDHALLTNEHIFLEVSVHRIEISRWEVAEDEM